MLENLITLAHFSVSSHQELSEVCGRCPDHRSAEFRKSCFRSRFGEDRVDLLIEIAAGTRSDVIDVELRQQVVVKREYLALLHKYGNMGL